jgi:hypothetical protein
MVAAQRDTDVGTSNVNQRAVPLVLAIEERAS